MNDLFILAAESMLKVYGTDAVLVHPYSDEEIIRVSPLFSSKLRREISGSGNPESEASVIINSCTASPVPQSDRLRRSGKFWNILSVQEICPGVFELELKG